MNMSSGYTEAKTALNARAAVRTTLACVVCDMSCVGRIVILYKITIIMKINKVGIKVRDRKNTR